MVVACHRKIKIFPVLWLVEEKQTIHFDKNHNENFHFFFSAKPKEKNYILLWHVVCLKRLEERKCEREREREDAALVAPIIAQSGAFSRSVTDKHSNDRFIFTNNPVLYRILREKKEKLHRAGRVTLVCDE